MSANHRFDSETHDENRRHGRGAFDETSQHAPGLGQSVEGTAYRSPEETLAARRRALEAELADLRARERATSRTARFASAAWSARRTIAATLIGLTLGVGVGATAAVAVTLPRVELDPYAARMHHRAIVRALRAAHREEAREERAREELVHAVEVRAARDAPAAPTPPPPDACGGGVERHVTAVGDRVWDVDRCVLDRGSVAAGGRFIPHSEHGSVVGLRVYGVRPGSLLGRLGVENGDLLVGLNGRPIGDDPLVAWTGIARSSRIVVDLVRRGEPTTFTYLVRDPAI